MVHAEYRRPIHQVVEGRRDQTCVAGRGAGRGRGIREVDVVPERAIRQRRHRDLRNASRRLGEGVRDRARERFHVVREREGVLHEVAAGGEIPTGAAAAARSDHGTRRPGVRDRSQPRTRYDRVRERERRTRDARDVPRAAPHVARGIGEIDVVTRHARRQQADRQERHLEDRDVPCRHGEWRREWARRRFVDARHEVVVEGVEGVVRAGREPTAGHAAADGVDGRSHDHRAIRRANHDGVVLEVERGRRDARSVANRRTGRRAGVAEINVESGRAARQRRERNARHVANRDAERRGVRARGRLDSIRIRDRVVGDVRSCGEPAAEGTATRRVHGRRGRRNDACGWADTADRYDSRKIVGASLDPGGVAGRRARRGGRV